MTANPIALVYRGQAASPGCPEALAALITAAGLGLAVHYVGPREARKLVPASFAGVALYGQPGGADDVSTAMAQIGVTGQRAIRGFVQGGGRYLGTCMGAYLVGEDPGLGLLSPGDTGEYSATDGADLANTDPAVIPIMWRGKVRQMWVQDPPYLVPSKAVGEQVIATYTNGQPAALVRPVGKGRVAVCGPHPEADQTWWDGLAAPYTSAADLGHDLIKELMTK